MTLCRPSTVYVLCGVKANVLNQDSALNRGLRPSEHVHFRRLVGAPRQRKVIDS